MPLSEGSPDTHTPTNQPAEAGTWYLITLHPLLCESHQHFVPLSTTFRVNLMCGSPQGVKHKTTCPTKPVPARTNCLLILSSMNNFNQSLEGALSDALASRTEKFLSHVCYEALYKATSFADPLWPTLRQHENMRVQLLPPSPTVCILEQHDTNERHRSYSLYLGCLLCFRTMRFHSHAAALREIRTRDTVYSNL